MPELLTTGCMLTCTFGVEPSELDVIEEPGKPVIDGALVAATMADMIPLVNILPFGMCTSMENPEVAAATAAALGVLTPMPCVPVVVDPWDPPSELMSYAGIPLATMQSTCLCAWGGEISADTPAETIVTTEI
ncbi:MAG: DUF4280 domain-containing protein [Proteobacteria bacterium]|nr:DUF4280 domain-containing protein [Pseudomonadota bacterium]